MTISPEMGVGSILHRQSKVSKDKSAFAPTLKHTNPHQYQTHNLPHPPIITPDQTLQLSAKQHNNSKNTPKYFETLAPTSSRSSLSHLSQTDQ